MYVLPDDGLWIEIFTYSVSTDSITQPDLSLIQLSILCKTFRNDLSRSYSKLITVSVVESK